MFSKLVYFLYILRNKVVTGGDIGLSSFYYLVFLCHHYYKNTGDRTGDITFRW